jgi:hypothetical protein
LVVFGAWDFQSSHKELSWSFESMITFALLIDIYPPCAFDKFSLNHSLETRERRGVPLTTKSHKIR